MSDDLIALQTTIAFQEHSLAELTDIVTAQQKQLDRLRLELKAFEERVAYLEGAAEQGAMPGAPVDEKPPHY